MAEGGKGEKVFALIMNERTLRHPVGLGRVYKEKEGGISLRTIISRKRGSFHVGKGECSALLRRRKRKKKKSTSNVFEQ